MSAGTAARPVLAGPPPRRPGVVARARERFTLPAGWPIAVAVAGYPLWWAAGLTPFVFPLAAAVLIGGLVRRGRVRVPPGFWLYLLFLAVVVLSVVMLDTVAPGTVPPEGAGRYFAFLLRLLGYLSMAVLMLYLGNTTERELPRSRVVTWLALLGTWSILLGLLAVAFPRASFPTLVSLLPGGLAGLVGEGSSAAELAQVQPVLGVASPRPAAPYAFTNAWGNATSLLMVWLVVAGWASRRRAVRVGVVVLLLLSAIPITYSLNRGMWIGLGASLAYVAVRFAARGRVLTLGAIVLLLALGSVVFVATPLQGMVTSRLDSGHSNDTRSSLAEDALKAAQSSPLLGYGSTRQTIGSDASIAVGQTPDCPKCGNRDVGSTGQFLLLLVAQGFLGLALYVAYFVRTLWAFRSDSSPIGIGGTLVVLLSLLYGLFYSALLVPLAATFLSIGLLWRNAQVRAAARAAASVP